ncbi:site-2 protease family protein [Candidatus Binatia bacterium]|nr:site-2 protease family protein [Candidatus Binatia bacterium]
MEAFVQQLSVWALPVLAAIILHEVAHGMVAYRLGDPTAARAGRLTLNPLPHIDPVGSVLVPLVLIAIKAPFLFGWARPVPVNYSNLHHPKRDMMFVAAAGPVTNILLAVASAVVLRLLMGMEVPADSVYAPPLVAGLTPLTLMVQNSIVVNIVLAVFNLLPILPLDGGRVMVGLLPLDLARAYARLEPYGMLIVVGLLATDVLDGVIGPVITVMLRVLL